VMLTTHPF